MSVTHSSKKKVDLFNSEEGDAIREQLDFMAADKSYRTEASYTPNGVTHPDHTMPFVEGHLTYLNKHSDVNPTHYLANLRLMLRIR
jgi:hypothetical protein